MTAGNDNVPCHFSVATTSTKPPAVLKADIRRVLDRMQVQYRETKTGFDCIHLPSIDISSLQDPQGTPTPSPRKHRKQGSAGSGDSGGTTRRIVRKASKLSFGMGRKDKDRTGEASVNGSTHKEKEKDLPGRPSGSGGGGGPASFGATQSSGSSSFFNVSMNTATPTTTPTPHADDASATLQLHSDESPRRSNSPARSKNLPPIPRDFGGASGATPQQHQQQLAPPTGEVNDREAFESVGQSTLSVRFEINIVKVGATFFLPVGCLVVLIACFLFCVGPVATIARYPVSSRGWRWVAVPDARATGPDGVEALTRYRSIGRSVSLSSSPSPFLPKSARSILKDTLTKDD